MARATLGYLWNAPLGGHGATPSRAGHDARRMVTGRVRSCTRRLIACAKSDTRRPIQAVTRPFLHTGRPCVCKVGHEISCNEPPLSACAHVGLRRVQSRTRDRQNGTVPVRLCTRAGTPCAFTDA